MTHIVGSSIRSTTIVRRPLRDRIVSPPRICIMYSDSTHFKRNLGPRFDNVPRRRRVSGPTVQRATPPPTNITLTPTNINVKTKRDDACIKELIPGLFVACSNSAEVPIKHPRNGHFTHFIHLSFEGEDDEKLITRMAYDDGAQLLRLNIPKQFSNDNKLTLTSPQLLTARNFLSLAMPYTYHLADDHSEYAARSILIATSKHHTADAMAVATCYLAYESGESAHIVLELLDEEDDIHGTWRGVVTEGGASLIEDMARA